MTVIHGAWLLTQVLRNTALISNVGSGLNLTLTSGGMHIFSLLDREDLPS